MSGDLAFSASLILGEFFNTASLLIPISPSHITIAAGKRLISLFLMKRIGLILLLVYCTTFVAAQRYSFYNLGVEDGLIQSQVRALAQDQYGHLWVGSLGGLSRYDGTQFTNYNVRNGIPANSVQAISTDAEGNIWIGTSEGISKYNGKEFKHYRFRSPEHPSGNSVQHILVTDKGTVWCHTDSSLYKFANGQFNIVPLPDSSAVISTCYQAGDTLWVGNPNGRIYRTTGNKWDTLYYYVPGYKEPLPLFTSSIARDSSGRLLVATGSGLFYIAGDTVKVVSAETGPLYNLPLTSLTIGKDGAIWMGSTQGAFCLRGNKLTRYNKSNGFTDNRISSALTDKEGNIWFGSDGQGIFRFSGGQFSILDEKSTLSSEQVMSFAATPRGNLYIGTADAGLFYKDSEKLIPIPLKDNDAFVSAILAANEYDIWIGTNRQGLWRLRGGERIYYNTTQMPGNAIIFNLLKDTSGKIWIATDKGIVVYEQNKFSRLPGLSRPVFAMAKISPDSLLVATQENLMLYTDSNFSAYTIPNTPANAHPQCIMAHRQKLLVGTSDNGLIIHDLDTKKTITLNKSTGLRSDWIYNITVDNKGNIWTGTGFGIHKVDISGEKPVITFYGSEQGITGMESNQNAAVKMPDGTLWFGTTRGAVHVDPEKQLITPQPVSIVLQSVKVFGDEIRDTTYYDSVDHWYNVPHKLSLPYKKNNVTFSFKAISLIGSGQLEYRYRLDGLDAPWSDWTPLNSVTYSALPPGNYTLKIESKTFNSNEVQALSYPFEIITPIHKTKWFSILIFIACILAGIIIQYLLNLRKQHRLALVEKLRREEQAKVRQRTAEDFHDEVGNKLTRINVLTNVLTSKMGQVSDDQERIINQIQENTAELYNGTKDILWSLQPANDNLFEILHRIRDFGSDLFADTEKNFIFPEGDRRWQYYRLPLDMSRNLIMIFKEALNNCLKYADANNVKMQISLKQNNILHIMLTDDGKGFNVEEVVKGNGLNNMRNRATRLKGKLYIDSTPGKGTAINLHFRLPKKQKSI